MEMKEFAYLKELDIKKPYDYLSSLCNDYSNNGVLYAAAYALLILKENKKVKYESIDCFIQTAQLNDERVNFIKESLGGIWNTIADQRDTFDVDTLKAIILFSEPTGAKWLSDGTPTGISTLAFKLLKVKQGYKVADLGTGRLGFIRDAFSMKQNASYFGIEINPVSKEIASIRAELLSGNIQVETGNILDLKRYENSFDCVFSNYPFGTKARLMSGGLNAVSEEYLNRTELTKTASMDWIYNTAVFNTVKETGRAVCIMTNGSTWNSLDRAARKMFLESGTIEKVIALPDRVFENTNIGTTMIVFSRGNKEVMMVDAREMCEKKRRINMITDSYVEKIIQCCKNETNSSKIVSYDEISDNDYVIYPGKYMDDKISPENGVPLGSIIKSITRGAQLTAKSLDDIISPTPTEYQYLMLSNIHDGMIDKQLPYLKEIDSRLEKYCLKHNSLIISKNGAPFKIAVADSVDDQMILANGNLYVIELDEEKADPFYVKAYLDSEKGIAALKSVVVGAAIPNIGVEALKTIQIPEASIEKQHEVAEKYRIEEQRIRHLRDELSSAIENLKQIFDNQMK